MPTNVVTPNNLGSEFEIGTNIANKITVKVDGTSVQRASDGTIHGASPVVDTVAKTMTFPSVNGAAAEVINLSEFLTDIHVDGATFDTTTSVLTLTDNDGDSPDVTIDLSAIKGASTDSDNVLTNGADGRPYLSPSAVLGGVSSDTENIATLGADNKVLVSESAVTDLVTQTINEPIRDAFGFPFGSILPPLTVVVQTTI